jgi:predicted PurR-regulated permease PerM
LFAKLALLLLPFYFIIIKTPVMNSLPQGKSRGFIETALALLLLLILLANLFTVLSVFLGVFTYAIIFSVSFAGLFESLVRLVKNKRKLAAFIYALLLIAIVAMPFIYIISALGDYADRAVQWVNDFNTHGVPALPAWIAELPYVGTKITAFWQSLQADPSGTIAAYEPQIKQTLQQLISGGAGLIGATLEFIVGIIISAILLASGEKILEPLYLTMKNLVGYTDGPALVDATGRAVKGVAVGVMGTAFVAALAAWIGFAIAGISFAVGLAALTFFLVVIQVGPVLVFIPAAIWLFSAGQTGMGIFISIYTLLVMIPIDNILKPVLIAKSGKLPILVLFLGVIGGMVAWGFTGMFKGAIILAVFYTIFNSWVSNQHKKAEAAVA